MCNVSQQKIAQNCLATREWTFKMNRKYAMNLAVNQKKGQIQTQTKQKKRIVFAENTVMYTENSKASKL